MTKTEKLNFYIEQYKNKKINKPELMDSIDYIYLFDAFSFNLGLFIGFLIATAVVFAFYPILADIPNWFTR